MPLFQAAIERAHRLYNTQSSADSALRIIFMRLGIAKIHEQAVAEILSDMPFKALDDLGTGSLVGTYHLTQVFGVEAAGEGCRIHQIAEQHGELTTLGVSGMWSSWWGEGILGGAVCLRWR